MTIRTKEMCNVFCFVAAKNPPSYNFCMVSMPMYVCMI